MGNPRFRHLIPITFLTGFYVSEVVNRYWDQVLFFPHHLFIYFLVGELH